MNGDDPTWYETVTGGVLSQGDVLLGVQVPIVKIDNLQQVDATLEADLEEQDLCVLTQSCDLENNKVHMVLLGRILDWEQLVAAKAGQGDHGFGGRRMREKVQQGNLPGYCLLHRHLEQPTLPWSVVDFHSLSVLPKPHLESHAFQMNSRLRLLSPYREHLSQALARYFMRVGLPHNAAAFLNQS